MDYAGSNLFFFFSLQILWFLGWLLFRFSFLLPSFLFFFFFFFFFLFSCFYYNGCLFVRVI